MLDQIILQTIFSCYLFKVYFIQEKEVRKQNAKNNTN